MSNIALNLFNFREHKISGNQYKFPYDIIVVTTFQKEAKILKVKKFWCQIF